MTGKEAQEVIAQASAVLVVILDTHPHLREEVRSHLGDVVDLFTLEGLKEANGVIADALNECGQPVKTVPRD